MTVDMNMTKDQYDEVVRESNKPAIEPGVYLAGLKSIEPHYGRKARIKKFEDGTSALVRSFGYSVIFTVNKNPDAVQLGWDVSDKTYDFNTYLWITHVEADADKRHSSASVSNTYMQLRQAYDVPADVMELDVDSFLGRVVRLRIRHEEDTYNSERLNTPGIQRASVGAIIPYNDPKTGNKAPVYEPLLRKAQPKTQF